MDSCKSQCNVCLADFDDIEDLAIHNLDHLVISISSVPLCPFCEIEMPALADFCRHVLNHFIEGELEQARFIEWLSKQNSDDFNSTNRTSKEEWKPVTVEVFEVRLPVITRDFKCLYCNKMFGGQGQKSVNHILSHFPQISSRRKVHVVLWFTRFFETVESTSIVETYCNYLHEIKKLDSNSHLLEKISMFENDNTNKCRLCQCQLPDAASLYTHYFNYHDTPIVSYWNCSICNYKEADSTEFVNHVYTKHMRCICGKKYRSFDSCLKHSNKCFRACPYCKVKLPFESMIRHLNRGRKDLICPYCGDREHDLEKLKSHVRSCSSPVPGVSCPTCKNFRFNEDAKLKEHLLECKPWFDDSSENKPCQPSPFLEKNNRINVYDIRSYLDEKIVGMIEDKFL
ncbi:zinc finger Y-chromosomal protein 1-like [Planococcus citri]|uniref:zinc finger Y-chromosomal protein 1-like n=1 Tax=Planococcus citri TaxID=170843 RepID=UPI0031F72656